MWLPYCCFFQYRSDDVQLREQMRWLWKDSVHEPIKCQRWQDEIAAPVTQKRWVYRRFYMNNLSVATRSRPRFDHSVCRHVPRYQLRSIQGFIVIKAFHWFNTSIPQLFHSRDEGCTVSVSNASRHLLQRLVTLSFRSRLGLETWTSRDLASPERSLTSRETFQPNTNFCNKTYQLSQITFSFTYFRDVELLQGLKFTWTHVSMYQNACLVHRQARRWAKGSR